MPEGRALATLDNGNGVNATVGISEEIGTCPEAARGSKTVLKMGDALWVGEVSSGCPHGQGDLILPNGAVHSGVFEAGRASGAGVLHEATGTVMTGTWVQNKKVGAFRTIDPKGGEWADVYDVEGKRVSRKKASPPPPNSAGAQKCRHCAVKFQPSWNTLCRHHSGKWMTAGSGSASGASAVDTEEFPEGGMWLCCGSKKKQGGERCAIGVHASADTAENQEVVVSYDEHGEVVLGPSGSLGGEPSMPRTSPGASVAAEVKAALDWRDRARSCVLSDAPFVCDSGLVWLDAGRHAPLAPLASLAECGKTGCACTRLLFPEVRTGFRREVVRRAVEGRASGRLPADGRIVYASIGAGLLLSDFDLICGLQQAGFTLTSVALIDPEYAPQPTSDRLQASERHLAALKDLTDYLGDDASVRTYASLAAYGLARLQAIEPAAHFLVQVDCDEVPAEDTVAISAVSLAGHDGGLGFRLANLHLPSELPMLGWQWPRAVPKAPAKASVEAPAPAEEVMVADTGAEAPAKASVEAPAPAEEVMVADAGAEAKGAARRRVVAPSLATLEAAMRKLGQEITNAQANSQPATAASELAHWLEEQGHECSPCYDEAVTR